MIQDIATPKPTAKGLAEPGLAERLLPLYPVLVNLPATLRDDTLAQHAQRLIPPADQSLFNEGAPCQGFPMLLAGDVQVARRAPQDRWLEFCRSGPGEWFVMSTACLFGHALLSAHAVTTQPTDLVVLSPIAFKRWTAVEPFRRFVFGVFADRRTDLMALAEAVAYQRRYRRLAGRAR